MRFASNTDEQKVIGSPKGCAQDRNSVFLKENFRALLRRPAGPRKMDAATDAAALRQSAGTAVKQQSYNM
jgi:hypothetical protein